MLLVRIVENKKLIEIGKTPPKIIVNNPRFSMKPGSASDPLNFLLRLDT